MNKIDLIKQPVEKELEEFRGLFEESLTSTDPLLGEVLAYIKKRSGKMMRPILVMLTAKPVSYTHLTLPTKLEV